MNSRGSYAMTTETMMAQTLFLSVSVVRLATGRIFVAYLLSLCASYLMLALIVLTAGTINLFVGLTLPLLVCETVIVFVLRYRRSRRHPTFTP